MSEILKVVGVPEHFNRAIKEIAAESASKSDALNISFIEESQGTGKMVQQIKGKEVDIAILLTEGGIKGCIAPSADHEEGYKIVQKYVQSPLQWGLHVKPNSKLNSIEDIDPKKIIAFISRPNSGSHNMLRLLAVDQGWNAEDIQLQQVGNMPGAIEAMEALSEEDEALFLWEHYTTKPNVEAGHFKRIGDFKTPWPCFIVAVRDSVLENKSEAVKAFLELVNQRAKEIVVQSNTIEVFSKMYGLKEEDVTSWLAKTAWSSENLSEQELEKIMDLMQEVGMLTTRKPASELLVNL